MARESLGEKCGSESGNSHLHKTGDSIREDVIGVLTENGIHVEYRDDVLIDILLNEYGNMENINKLIIFARLVKVKLDDISDFFGLKIN